MAGALSGMIRAIVPEAIVIPWDTTARPDIISPTDDPITVAKKLAWARSRGTYMEAPTCIYMLQKDIPADYVVMITD